MVAAAEEGMEVAAEVGEPLFHATCLMLLIMGRTWRGEVAEARAALERWGDHLFRSKGLLVAEMLAMTHTWVAAAEGNAVEAQAAAEAALIGYRAFGFRYGVANPDHSRCDVI
jgi:hypothetical protein